MKHIIILTIFLSSALCYSVKPQINAQPSVEPYIFEDLINSTIEGIRPAIPDTIEVDSLVLSLPDEEDAIIKGNASIANLKLSGLHDFQLAALNFALIGLNLNFTLDLPVLDFSTDYTLNLFLANTVPIYGDGNIDVHLEDVDIQASVKVDLSNGIALQNLRVQLYLGDAQFDIHGLFNDEELSDLLSAILNDLVAKLLDDNQELITQIISPIIEAAINAIIGALGEGTSL